MTKVNRGKKMPKTSYELTLSPSEHIDFMQYRFNDEGIYEVVLKTSEGRMLMMDEAEHEDLECDQLDFNLSDAGEALIGFKGQFDNYISNLAFYKATRVGFKTVKRKQQQQDQHEGVMRLASIKSDYSERHKSGEYYGEEEEQHEDYEYDKEEEEEGRGGPVQFQGAPVAAVRKKLKKPVRRHGDMIEEDLM
ncbi:hypothetical protein FGO68_gene6686 [Halteria grandinella]|uniref:Uncharacterized protein n=1 Tax=Halteria grandinella TaxID=5974 RepID=A0A8J8NJS5_HALGN|nr:hypothetical protein FGO68_gene6686 [Halteria grandinella]